LGLGIKSLLLTAVLSKWGFSVYLEELVVAFPSFFELFSFNLFGIFVNVSNKSPHLYKAPGR